MTNLGLLRVLGLISAVTPQHFVSSLIDKRYGIHQMDGAALSHFVAKLPDKSQHTKKIVNNIF